MTDSEPFPEEFHASIEIAAAPEAVWALIADVTRIGEWSPEAVGAEWSDGATGPAPGAHFEGHNKIGDFTWDAPCAVVDCVPGQVFSWRVPRGVGPDTSSTWTFEFAAVGRGTRVTQSFHTPLLNVKGSPSNFEGRYEMLCAGVQTTLANLKAAVE